MNQKQALSAARKMYGEKARIVDRGPEYPKTICGNRLWRYVVVGDGYGRVRGQGDNWAEAIADAKGKKVPA